MSYSLVDFWFSLGYIVFMKLRFKNNETDTVWTTTTMESSEDDDGDSASYGRNGSLYEQLEDTDLVVDLKEIVDSLLDIEPNITWTEKVLKVSFDDIESDSDIRDAIGAIIEHIQDACGIEVVGLDEVD